MSDPGSLKHSGQVAAAVRAHVNAWFLTYLAAMERQLALPARTYPDVRSRRTAAEIDQWLDDVPPALLIACPGTLDTPETTSSSYRARWDVRVGVIVEAGGGGDPDTIAGVYGAAVRAAMVQHQTLGGFATGVRWLGEDLDGVPGRKAETHAMSLNRFGVDTDDVLPRAALTPPGANPNTPPGDPYAPLDPYPASPLVADITVTLPLEDL